MKLFEINHYYSLNPYSHKISNMECKVSLFLENSQILNDDFNTFYLLPYNT